VLGPLGLPLATDVVSGEQADDGLYLPSIQRLLTIVTQAGLLFVGDGQLSALATRAYVRAHGHHYLAPWALVGDTRAQMRDWVQAALNGTQPLTPIPLTDAQGQAGPLVPGYETTRACTAAVAGPAGGRR